MDERMRFVARMLEGEKTAALCAEFGISRQTGYKIVQRYQAVGGRHPILRHNRRQAGRNPAVRAVGLAARSSLHLQRGAPSLGAGARADSC